VDRGYYIGLDFYFYFILFSRPVQFGAGLVGLVGRWVGWGWGVIYAVLRCGRWGGRFGGWIGGGLVERCEAEEEEEDCFFCISLSFLLKGAYLVYFGLR